MDIFSRAACLEALDKAFSSHIGKAVSAYLSAFQVPLQELNEFENLKQNLIFDPPENISMFMKRVNEVIERLTEALGTETDISYGIQNVGQIIEEELKGMLPGSMDQWRDALNSFLEQYSKILNFVPESKTEYLMLSKNPPIPEKRTKIHRNTFKFPEEINIHKIQEDISHIIKDEDIEYIVDLLSTYEPHVVYTPTTLDVIPQKISPYILTLLNSYLKKCELRDPTPPPSPVAQSPNLRLSPSLQAFMQSAVAQLPRSLSTSYAK